MLYPAKTSYPPPPETLLEAVSIKFFWLLKLPTVPTHSISTLSRFFTISFLSRMRVFTLFPSSLASSIKNSGRSTSFQYTKFTVSLILSESGISSSTNWLVVTDGSTVASGDAVVLPELISSWGFEHAVSAESRISRAISAAVSLLFTLMIDYFLDVHQ